MVLTTASTFSSPRRCSQIRGTIINGFFLSTELEIPLSMCTSTSRRSLHPRIRDANHCTPIMSIYFLRVVSPHYRSANKPFLFCIFERAITSRCLNFDLTENLCATPTLIWTPKNRTRTGWNELSISVYGMVNIPRGLGVGAGWESEFSFLSFVSF